MTRKREVARIAKKMSKATGFNWIECKKVAKVLYNIDYTNNRFGYFVNPAPKIAIEVTMSPRGCDCGCYEYDSVFVVGPKGIYVHLRT